LKQTFIRIVMPREISKERAMTLMGFESLHDRDDMHNLHEQKLFDWKQELLQKYMVPALLRNKLPLLEEIIFAEEKLVPEIQTYEVAANNLPLPSSDRIAMLEQYEARISQLKLSIMQSNTFAGLNSIVQQLIQLQEDYMHAFSALFSSYSEALPEEVNSREMMDTGKLLHALKQGEPDNKMVWAIERELTRIKKIEGIR